MSDVVVCPACGVKIKAGRARCLRCGATLTEPVRPGRKVSVPIRIDRRPLVVWGTLVVLFVLFGWLALREPAPQPSQEPTAAAVAPQPGPTFAPSTASGGVPIAAPPFVESSRLPPGVTGATASEVERFRAAVQRDPYDAKALNDLALALAGSGNPAEALQYHRRTVERAPQVWEYRFHLARAYGQRENWTGAAAEYQAARELAPGDDATLYNLGFALHRLGRDEDAIALYREAIASASGEATFHLALGISLERLQRPGEAAEAYRQYLELAPDDATRGELVKVKIEALQALDAAETVETPGTPRAPATDSAGIAR